ncbi:MAG: hypothetical protein JJT76_12000 [Clostridiaceae bacterium]|nr:hypothetical protein [Clostridiaceae bacterium]
MEKNIKPKHPFNKVAVFLSILLMVYIFLPSAMLFIGQRYENKGNEVAAKVYYDRMDRFFPNRSATAQALERASDIISSNNLLVVSTNGVGSGFFLNDMIITKEAQPYYERLVERFPDTWQGRRARNKLATQKIKNKINQNKIHEAFSIMQKHYEDLHANAPTHYADATLVMETLTFLRGKGLYEEGLQFLDLYMDNYQATSINLNLYEAAGDLHAFLGNKEEAMEYYKTVLEAYEKNAEREVLYDESHYNTATVTRGFDTQAEALLRKIKQLSNESLSHGSVAGSISLRDIPFKEVNIFLQPQPQDQHNITIMGAVKGEAIWTMSNEDGSFFFDYLTPGRYSLGFVLDLEEVGDVVLKGGFFPQSTIMVVEDETSHWDFQLVDTITVTYPLNNEKITGDKVHFQWEPFEEAAYYTLELGSYDLNSGGASSTPYSGKKFYTNEAILTIEELTYTPRGMMFTDEGPDPGSFFGFAHPKGKYFWGVVARDKEGNALTSSRGYLKGENTDFHFTDRDLRQGDYFILERNFEEAIEAYEEDLINNPEDIYALSMLGKLYGLAYGNHDIYPYTDLDKAIAYYERLYTITEDITFLNNINGIVYRDKKDYDKTLEILKILEENNALHPWHINQLAMIYNHQGNYEKALKTLLEIDDTSYQLEALLRVITNNFEGLNPSILGLTEEKWLEALKQYEENYAFIDSELKEAINTKPPLEALDLFSKRDLTPHEALLQIALKAVEPSISINEYEEVKDFIKEYGEIDPILSDIVKGLFMIFI